MPQSSSYRVVEHAVRASYGRLIALLTRRTHDVMLAQDMLGDALLAALETWPRDGVPERPEAWLLRVAQRHMIDMARRQATRDRYAPVLEHVIHELATHEVTPDRRLDLLFMCAHPGIAASIRAPLMLQVVLGLNAQQIGRAFLVAPKTMGQRLSRAKRKIRDARIPFDLSEALRLERVPVVCEAIYGAFATGYNNASPSLRQGLVDEALWLARLLMVATDHHPETAGLLALMLYIEARRPARRSPEGAYVPLDQQDPQRWDRALIDRAEKLLWHASQAQQPGRFQLEAAIQSVHAQRIHGRATDWLAIEQLYGRLRSHADTLGAQVAHLAVQTEVYEPAAVYNKLVVMDAVRVADHQAYWALRAHLERRLGRDAAASTQRAMALSEDPAVRAFLRRLDTSSRVG